MKYCSHCGAQVELKVPEGDNLPRFVCVNCATIHYQNPKIVTGCIPVWENRILLCRRAIEPRYGLWTLPAGFMENNETTAQAAARETMEEANAKVDILDLYALYNIPHISQVYLMFLANLVSPDFSPGEESLDVKLFEEHEIPWNELAFPVVMQTLKRYFNDRKTNKFPFYLGDIHPIK